MSYFIGKSLFFRLGNILLQLFLLINLIEFNTFSNSFSQEVAKTIDIVELEKSKPLEREIKGGEIHSYKIELTAEQFLHLSIEQKSIPLSFKVYDPRGNEIVEVIIWQRFSGNAPFYFKSEVAGSYRIDLYPIKGALIGRYSVNNPDVKEVGACEIEKNDGSKPS